MPELAKGIIATEDGLGIYLPKIRSLVIADLHLGVELALFGEGTYMPIDQYQIMQNSIINLIEKYNPESLIINGDFKHEFARPSRQEWYELKALSKVLSDYGVELELVRGNHDNYLKTILAREDKTLREPYYLYSDYLFVHGHQSLSEIFDTSLPEVSWVILAHEHPAIELRDSSGGKHKFRCYLKGTWGDYNLLVLPAYSPIASGSIINKLNGARILSPILKDVKLEEFKPLIVDKGELLKFPKLKQLSNIQ